MRLKYDIGNLKEVVVIWNTLIAVRFQRYYSNLHSFGVRESSHDKSKNCRVD